jgi:hypothetical protein
MHTVRARRGWEFWVVLLLLAVTCGAAAWWRAFTWFVTPDDEGTLIYALRAFTGGRAVFNELHSFYGPLWFVYECIPRELFHIPMNHDTAHAAAALWWTAGTLSIFILIHRMTGSMALAAVAAFLGFRILQFVGYEPAHPQAICVVILLLLILAAGSRGFLSMASLGALLAAAILTKVNFGVFLAIGSAVVFAPALPLGRWRTAVATAAAAAAILFPAVLMSAHLGNGWAMRYAGLVMLSLIAAIMASAANRLDPLSWRQAGMAAGGAALAAIAILPPVLMRGNTIGGIFQSIFIKTAGFSKVIYYPLDISPLAVVWAAVAIPLAWMGVRGRIPPPAMAVLKLAIAVAIGGVLYAKAWTAIIEIGTPMLWLVAVPRMEKSGESHFMRPLLAVAGVLLVLYAFPTAGSQAHFSAILILAAGAICAADALEWFSSTWPVIQARPLQAAVATLVLLSVARAAFSFHSYYQETISVGLPGAEILHLETKRVQTLHRLNYALKTCSMLLSVPGLPSLSIFSGTPAPSSLTGLAYFNGWLAYASDSEQEAAIREAEASPKPCAVFHPELTALWIKGSEEKRRPLYDYVQRNFHEEFETGGYRFLSRRDQASRNSVPPPVAAH